MAPAAIAIFSNKNDLHAWLIERELRKRGAACHIIETDDQLSAGGLEWRSGSGTSTSRLRSHLGKWIDPAELSVIWWRRVRAPQRDPDERIAPAERAFVTAAWRDSIYGVVESAFNGTWINHPLRAERAESKLIQLGVADECGLRVPRTLVSQVPDAVRAFVDELRDRRVVIKKVAGAPGSATQTVTVDRERLHCDELIEACPTIYQEVVPGTRHLRVHMFGHRTVTVSVSTEQLDWRVGLPGRYEPYELPATHEAKLRAFLDRLGLTMAIFDLKIDHSGCLWFLEANPQGQFLFMQGMSGVDLVEPMCDCLVGG